MRCIKPNKQQAGSGFTPLMVLDQLRCSGVVEAVKVMQQAYATRIPYEDIHGRYAPLMGAQVMKETGDDPAAFCEAVALACEVAPADYALGLSKLFLKVSWSGIRNGGRNGRCNGRCNGGCNGRYDTRSLEALPQGELERHP